MENLNEKNHREVREIPLYQWRLQLGSGVLGFLDTIDRPPSWKGSTIYTGSFCWIRLKCPALFKHSTAYLRGG